MSSQVFPGFSNVFIPGTNADTDGRLIVGFSRNKAKFGLPNYCQYVPVEQPMGYYLKLTNQEAARVVNLQDFAWPDGQNRPQRNRDLESFTFVPFAPQRYDFGFTVGNKANQFADWPILEQNCQVKAAQAMTHATLQAWAALTTSANWTAANDPNGDLSVDHYAATGTALAGAALNTGSSTNPVLKNAMSSIAQQITLDTLSVVQGTADEIIFVCNPYTAGKLAESAELLDFIKGSPFSGQEILEGWTKNAMYGMPPFVHGYRFIVEPTVQVASRVGGVLQRQFAVPNGALVALSVVGGLEGVYGAPSFSTLTRFYLEEFTMERFPDLKNRLTEASVVRDDFFAVTCPASGYYIANCLA